MHNKIRNNSQGNIKSELEFRIWFRDQFGIDYIQAVKELNERKAETERQWRQVLTSNNII